MKYSILIILTLLSQNSFSQKTNKIAFYNVENLFDTINGPNIDEEYLPKAKKNWNSSKYYTKINHIRKVIIELKKPIIMGFCELENRLVLEDLISDKALKNYRIVHFDSKDARGIDVGIIYNSCVLTEENSGILRFNLPHQNEPTTRDILFASFLYKKDKIHVLVNHWPSRRGGVEESKPKRMKAAQQAKKYIDSILNANSKAKIILMGDLNDSPDNNSVKLIGSTLHPMIKKESGSFGGTHQYKGQWDILDHIFVSNGCFEGKKKIVKNSGKIHEFEFLMEVYKGNKQPYRTFVGSKYLGGYSDHLPVSVEIK